MKTKAKRRKIYLKAAERLEFSVDTFICTSIASVVDPKCNESTSQICTEANLPELFLFKEVDDYTWVSHQVRHEFPELYFDRQEVRKNILLLCAEMCKP